MWTEQLKLHTMIPSQVRRLEIKEKRRKKKRNDKIRKIKEQKRIIKYEKKNILNKKMIEMTKQER